MPAIGETLREARMRQQLGIADVEASTKIRAKYLRALENEEWHALPGHTFVKTFLRTYAEMVGVDAHLLVEEYRAAHETEDDEFEVQPLAGRPAAGRRENRRRAPRGPPSKGAVAVTLAGALVVFLLVLGILSGRSDDQGSQEAGGGVQRQTERQSQAKPKRRKKRPAPSPASGVRVRVVPTVPTYVCLDTGEGTDVVFEGTLEGPRTFRHAKRLRVNLGKRALGLRVNGKPVEIPASPEPVGYDMTPAGTREIAQGSRPCA